MFRYLPEQASEFAHKVDYATYVVTDLSVFFTVAIVGTMIYFAIRYRRIDGVDHETPRIEGNNFLEVLWTVIPSIIVVWVGYLGWDSWHDLRAVPDNAMEINVTGYKWAWDFEYKNGKKTTAELVVPVDEPVKLVMTSKDVLHSFFIPVMRTKADVIPGRYTYVWFKPIMTGDFQVFCTEYCGNEHSRMLARLKVLPKNEYERWVNDFSEQEKITRMSGATKGLALYNQKQCVTCHSLDGSRKVGPTWLKLFGTKHKKPDGSELLVDENYIHTSILKPNDFIVEGYAPAMPSFEGQLSESDITAIIDFIKTVTEPLNADGTPKSASAPEPQVDKSKLSPAERGKLLYSEKTCNACHSLDGSKVVGPSFKGIYGRKGKLSDGSEYVADDAYIKESILNPAAKLVEGFGPGMPLTFKDQLSEQDLNDIVEFLKTVK